MAGANIDILMYHSIAEAEGPTSIAPDVFAAQMQAIADANVPVITMDDLLAAHRGKFALPDYSIVISFDDGFRDFSQNACPELMRHGYRAIVYLPSDKIGREEDWTGAHTPPRQLMSWHEILRHQEQGILFGSHTVSHSNLNALEPEVVEQELKVSRERLKTRLNTRIRHFAPPYGLANPQVRAAIGTTYRTSVGTELGSATPDCDLLDLPRIEMFYFTDLKRWRDRLAGRGAGYLRARRMLRTVRQTVLNPWQ